MVFAAAVGCLLVKVSYSSAFMLYFGQNVKRTFDVDYFCTTLSSQGELDEDAFSGEWAESAAAFGTEVGGGQ
jgi:hypothetical protein